MVPPQRPLATKRGSMRPPPRPAPTSSFGRSQSPAGPPTTHGRSPSVQPASAKRKERDFEADDGEETNINVVVRCRGRNDREVRENSGVVVSVDGLKGNSVELSMGPNALSNKTYHFDKVFSPAADQAIVFDDVVKPYLGEMLSGYNCTVFAYGQTGTGKTYTMSGDMTDTLGILSDAAGIIPRVLYTLFQKLEADEVECAIKCSFIELYNEELRDLLSPEDSTKLKIYDDNSKKSGNTTMVQGMEESHIKSAGDGIKLLRAGSYRRQVAATKCNDLSSRSHTVFTITAYVKKPGDASEDFISAGKLNLVDLAGSENIQRSGAENKRAAEAGLINKSLLTLGRVINALVDKNAHIPYRESKLTRLLQDSLGGRTKTCIIATVSPAKSNLEETISTLDYAFRAKNIRNKPQVNSMISKKTLLKEFTAEIEKLKSELIATRQRNGVYLSNEQFEEITVESESRRILSEEQSARIETLETSLRNKVQDLFTLTNNFNGVKRDNETTRLALEGTKDVLSQTEIVLRDTKQLLSEEQEIRRAHQSTEEQLRHLGTGLVSQLDESVDQLSGLHSKLRRRSDLHHQNRATWETSAAAVAEVAKSVDEESEAFRVEQASMLAALSDRITQFASAETEKIRLDQASLKSRAAEYENIEAEVRQQTTAARDDMNLVLEEIKVLREDVKDRVGEGLNGLSAAAARIAGEVISELEQFHTQLHLSYSALGRDFKSIFEDVVKHASSQQEEVDELRKQLQEANRQLLSSNTAVSSSIEQCINDERDAARKDREKLVSQFKVLMDDSAKKQDVRLVRHMQDTRSQLLSSRCDFERASVVFNEGMEQRSQKNKAFMHETIGSRDSLKHRLTQDWTDINTRNTAIQNTTKSVHDETVRIVDAQLKDMAVQMAALDEFVGRAREQNGRHHNNHGESLGKLALNARQTLADADESYQTASSRIKHHKSAASQDLASLDTNLSTLSATIQRPISEISSTMSSTPLTDYIATGDTPQKRPWDYPRDLPRTASHETLLARLRGQTTSPKKSPRKRHGSPRKAVSPIKASSPSKTRIFMDDPTASGSTTFPLTRQVSQQSSAGESGDEKVVGLREMDINVLAASSSEDLRLPLPSSRPQTAAAAGFSKSVNSGMQPPPLKRHATAALAETRAQRKGRENHAVILSQSVGPGTGLGRRLRSSPK